MNRFIARCYSKIIEGLHALFILGVVLVALYFSGVESRYSPLMIGFTLLLVIVGWVVVFGFITTVVVMADTLNEIKKQNELANAFLQKLASFPMAPQNPSAARPRPPQGEPFIGSSRNEAHS